MDALTELPRYGPGVVGLLVMLECLGLPLPGETVMVAAAVYAARTGRMSPWALAAAASTGAVLGGIGGFAVGRLAGGTLLLRYGPRLGLNADRRLVGQYLMRNGGGALVFFGRFMPVFRALAALLAGAAGMGWRRFLVFNLLGGLVWPEVYVFGGFTAGAAIGRFTAPAGVLAAVAGVGALVALAAYVRRHERSLIVAARAARDGAAREGGDISPLPRT